MKITLLGGGNMARAIVGGLVSHGFEPKSITVVDRNPEKAQSLAQDYGVRAQTSTHAVLENTDLLILAVKPQGLTELLNEVGDSIIQSKPLVISILSGIRLSRLAALLPDIPLIRVMPNTPTRVNAGMTLLCAGLLASSEHLSLAQGIFSALGQTYIAKTEREFEQLTALTGCGPAFVFYLVQTFAQAMQAIDSDVDASDLTLQTFAGALALMQQEQVDPATLIAQVTSKGGMTEQSMKVLYAADLESLFKETLNAAIKRGDELADVI